MLHTFPTAAEIVTAVREFLLHEVLPQTDGTLSFHARVAANLLAALEREVVADPAEEQRFAAALADLGAQDEAELAQLLRTGALSCDSALLAVLRDATTARLQVSNPRYLVDDVDDDPRHQASTEHQ